MKKIVSTILLISCLFFFSGFEKLSINDPAPFEGYLLSKETLSKIIQDQKQEGEKCQIRIDAELEKLADLFDYERKQIIDDCYNYSTFLEERIKITMKGNEFLQKDINDLDNSRKFWKTLTIASTGIAGVSILLLVLFGGI